MCMCATHEGFPVDTEVASRDSVGVLALVVMVTVSLLSLPSEHVVTNLSVVEDVFVLFF